MSLAVVEPSSLVQVDEQCTSIELWAEQPDRTIAELRDAGHKLAAIDEYLARTSTEGRARVAATQRRLEVRIGVLLGPATVGAHSSATEGQDLSRHERSEFRKMAEHPDVVDEVIAGSTDEQPASRRKVVDKIKEIVRNEADKAAAARDDRRDLAEVAENAAATGWDMDEGRGSGSRRRSHVAETRSPFASWRARRTNGMTSRYAKAMSRTDQLHRRNIQQPINQELKCSCCAVSFRWGTGASLGRGTPSTSGRTTAVWSTAATHISVAAVARLHAGDVTATRTGTWHQRRERTRSRAAQIPQGRRPRSDSERPGVKGERSSQPVELAARRAVVRRGNVRVRRIAATRSEVVLHGRALDHRPAVQLTANLAGSSRRSNRTRSRWRPGTVHSRQSARPGVSSAFTRKADAHGRRCGSPNVDTPIGIVRVMSLLREDKWFAPTHGWTRAEYDQAHARATQRPAATPDVSTKRPAPTSAAEAFLAAVAPHAWMADAACRGVDTAIFFPERGGDVRPALEYCARCTVIDDCLAVALEHGVNEPGVWGGTTGRQRGRLRRAAA